MPDAAKLLKGLRPDHANCVERVAEAAERRGASPYLVGGTVRDLMLRLRPADLDISVEGGSPELAAAIANELNGEVYRQSQFGTWKLRAGDTVVDLAMTRRESYERAGALPAVAPGSIQEDLARRDFSINAMAVSLSRRSWGHLLDPFRGRDDLAGRRIKVLHGRSFADDATRVLRGVRYAGRLEFDFDPDTGRRIACGLGYLDTIKGDRVRREIQRIFHEKRAGPILCLAQDMGVLRAVHPALRPEEPVLARLHQLAAASAQERELSYLSLLAYSARADEMPGLIARLNMDGRWARVARDTIAVKDRLAMLAAPDCPRSEVYALLRPFDAVAVKACAFAASDALAVERLRAYVDELRHVKPMLTGDDVIAMGIPAGRRVGRIIDELLVARLDGLLATRQDEEAFVLQWAQRGFDGGEDRSRADDRGLADRDPV